jgi:Cyclin.
MLCYLRRIRKTHPEFLFTFYNAHRLIITTTVIVHKFFSDYYYRNSFYAQIGGIKAREMNYLEVEMLGLLDFNLTLYEKEVFIFFFI